MIKKIKEGLWKISFKLFGSNVYLFKYCGKNIIIDTGAFWNRLELKKELKEIGILPEEIEIVLLTHNHFDHTGNIKIFKNAKIYGSKIDFENKILNDSFSEEIMAEEIPEDEKKVEGIIDLDKLKIDGMEVIEVPGHTKGNVVFYLPKEKILFSGDHIFENGYIGRTDLPNSLKDKMKESLEKTNKLDYNIFCPGHDYGVIENWIKLAF